jgi:peptidoglycan hydrolase CwlO-like protein
MNSMQESHNELQKVLMRKQKTEPGTQTLLKELEEKIDGLKLDIQKLNDILKK